MVWSLYANSNNTAARRDVAYDGRVWQVPNHFFPVSLSALKRWSIGDGDIGLATDELATVKDAHERLKTKLLPQLYALGFLP